MKSPTSEELERLATRIGEEAGRYAIAAVERSRMATWDAALKHMAARFPRAPRELIEGILQPLAQAGLFKGGPRKQRRKNEAYEYVDSVSCVFERTARRILRPVFKIGGAPVFVDAPEWPKCKRCRREMDFLAQIPLDKPLALSRTFHMAYLFMCEGFDDLELSSPRRCGRDWRIFLQRRRRRPVAVERESRLPEYRAALMERQHEPMVDTSDERTPENVADQVSGGSKLGGVPAWLQSSEKPRCPACRGPVRFIAQIDSELDDTDIDDLEPGDAFMLSFGDAGTGYVFLCARECGPLGAKLVIQF